jgi:hypothetical protein
MVIKPKLLSKIAMMIQFLSLTPMEVCVNARFNLPLSQGREVIQYFTTDESTRGEGISESYINIKT